MVIKPQFKENRDFTEGLARVKVDKKWGYIDKTGNYVIKSQFDKASNFRDGIARVEFVGLFSRKIGYVDKTGKYIWIPSN